MEEIKFSNTIIILIIFLVLFDIFLWQKILFNDNKLKMYFLDVGQGDSELLFLPGEIETKFLIDGGKDGKVVQDLSLIPFLKRRIDLIILSHPEEDHFGGLAEVLKRYKVGAFIYNGLDNTSESWKELKNILKERDIQTVVLGEGDKIIYGGSEADIISPGKKFLNPKDLNNSSLVLLFKSEGVNALFIGDISKKVEDYLRDKYDLKADILKVAHHGSKNSSSLEFVKEISPKISFIEVGKNSYGHPTEDVLNRLANIGSQIFRTDEYSNLKVQLEEGKNKLIISSIK